MMALFDEVKMVESYLNGENIPERALDDCVFQISKYLKERGFDQIETKKIILQWLKENDLFFVDINNNIDNAFKTKSKLVDGFHVEINSDDIERINFSADFLTSKKVALFLLVYAKVHANQEGEFRIRIATMSKWIGIDRANLYKRHINPLITYGFIENVEQKDFSKYTSQKREEKWCNLRIKHALVNHGDYIIEKNEDFENLFKRIFVK